MKKGIKWDVMATLFVGIMGAWIAIEANKIGNLQAQIAVQSSLPNIQINEKYVIDEETGNAVATVLEISNLEGRLDNYDSSIVSVIKYSYSDMGTLSFEVNVPISAYYYASGISGVTNGLIETKYSYDNFKKISELRKKVRMEKNDDEICNLGQVESYIKITYRDLLNNERVEYYRSDAIYTNRLDEEQGKLYFEKYMKLWEEGYAIDLDQYEKLSAESLKQIAYSISELEDGNRELSKKIIQSTGEKSMIDNVINILGIVIASISLFVAIRAIKQQNRGIVFNNRLEVYMEIERISLKCARIVEVCKTVQPVYRQKNIITACMFNMKDEAFEVARKAIELEANVSDKCSGQTEDIKENVKWAELLECYAKIYINQYLDSDIESKLRLFYSKEIADSAIELYRRYDEMRLGLLVIDEEELSKQMAKIEDSMNIFEEKSILKKMKKELPV